MPTLHLQLGAREHYALPRRWHEQGLLGALITEAWAPPGSVWRILPGPTGKALAQRFHADLHDAPVFHATLQSIAFELRQRLAGRRGWNLLIARNQWFQQIALNQLKQLAFPPGEATSLFAYSYAALEPFRYAKKQGWQAILGQIDPGPQEEQIVAKEHQRYPYLQDGWEPAPPAYWESWREECALADRIQVNSEWSKQALIQIGIPAQKLEIVPLVYETPAAALRFQRTSQKNFSPKRPLRALFLGQVILRKGIARILEAALLLKDYPVEIHIVGPVHPSLKAAANAPNLYFHGPVSRAEVDRFYQMADLFLFPTLSDGYGLTQLEAQAWQLPIIASKHCGQVVENGVNGVVLDEVTPKAIAEAVLGELTPLAPLS